MKDLCIVFFLFIPKVVLFLNCKKIPFKVEPFHVLKKSGAPKYGLPDYSKHLIVVILNFAPYYDKV